jgi:hypothetical protein
VSFAKPKRIDMGLYGMQSTYGIWLDSRHFLVISKLGNGNIFFTSDFFKYLLPSGSINFGTPEHTQEYLKSRTKKSLQQGIPFTGEVFTDRSILSGPVIIDITSAKVAKLQPLYAPYDEQFLRSIFPGQTQDYVSSRQEKSVRQYFQLLADENRAIGAFARTCRAASKK